VDRESTYWRICHAANELDGAALAVTVAPLRRRLRKRGAG
jgi:hypothetical protein